MYKIINKSEFSKCTEKKRAIGLGVFDGFHFAHRELVGILIEESIAVDLCPCIYTFVKSSENVEDLDTKKSFSDGLIFSEEKRRDILFEAGIEEIIVQDFNSVFADVPALDFLENYLYKNLNVRQIVVGFNFRFGKNRDGDVSLMKKWASGKDVKIIVIDPVNYKDNKISSSRIREHLKKGDIFDVNAMLGRKYSISGVVEQGQKLGRKLGFPTANIVPGKNLAIPKNGVYLTKTIVRDKTYESVTNIGIRPSIVNGANTLVSETILLGKEINLYGEYAEVLFLEFLRPEEKFESLDELSIQIGRDVENAKIRHLEVEDFSLLAKVNNINIYGLKTERFATSVLEIDFRMKLSPHVASANNLLSSVLTATCKKYNTRPGFAKKLDSLYGAFIESHVECQGDLHLSSYTADALNMTFDGENPFIETVRLMFDLFQNPDTDENMNFREDIIESEKKSILSDIKARKNDKQKYAFDKCLENYTEDSVFGVRSFGDIKILDQMTGEDVKNAFLDLKNNSEISIYLAGKFDDRIVDEVCILAKEVFAGNKCLQSFIPPIEPGTYKSAGKQISKTENLDVEQSKICALYRLPVSYFSWKITAASVLNIMLGGDVHSLLFQKVREEMGLAYSIYSSILKYLSAIVIIAGVAHENVEIALTAMDAQVRKIADGQYDDELFKSSIASGVFANKSIYDSLHSIIRYYSNNIMRGVNIDSKASLNYLFSIKKEDIEKIASEVSISTIYKVSGGINEK